MSWFTILVAAALMLPGAAWAQEQWFEYRPEGGRFRVELPGSPTITTETPSTPDGPIHATSARVQPSANLDCTARHSDYRAGTVSADPQARLDRSRDALGKFPLRSEKRLTIRNLPARRMVFELPGQRVATGLWLVTGDRLIQVLCIVPADQENSSTVERIFKSFAPL